MHFQTFSSQLQLGERSKGRRRTCTRAGEEEHSFGCANFSTRFSGCLSRAQRTTSGFLATSKSTRLPPGPPPAAFSQLPRVAFRWECARNYATILCKQAQNTGRGRRQEAGGMRQGLAAPISNHPWQAEAVPPAGIAAGVPKDRKQVSVCLTRLCIRLPWHRQRHPRMCVRLSGVR